MKIIAEIGMNHMGDEEYLGQYLGVLGVACPDGVTLQVQTPEYYAEKSHIGLALSDECYQRAVKRAKELGLHLGATLCDAEKVAFFEGIGTDFYKILSKDIGNQQLIATVLATLKPVYVSTGMSSEEDIQVFRGAFGQLPSNLSLIHTQLSYDDADTNLRAIGRLRERFGVPVAFGLHSTDVNALYASLGFSPSALFFYVKGGREIKHRDEAHAIPLTQCAGVVTELRRLGNMMGDGFKKKMTKKI